MPSAQTIQYVYSALGNDQDLASAVTKFVDELPRCVESIRLVSEKQNLQAVASRAHQLKGAGQSYGFEAVSKLAARLEEDCQAQLPYSEIVSTVAELTSICERVRAGAPK